MCWLACLADVPLTFLLRANGSLMSLSQQPVKPTDQQSAVNLTYLTGFISSASPMRPLDSSRIISMISQYRSLRANFN